MRRQPGELKIAVTVSDLAGTEAALRAGADIIYFSGQVYSRAYSNWLTELTPAWELGREAQVPVFVHLERITENQMLAELERALQGQPFDGVLVGNFGTWRSLRDRFPGLPVHADWSFNLFNSWTAWQLAEAGASLVTAS